MSTADAEARTTAAAQESRLAVVLVVGGAIWLVLLLAGFFAPGGWSWGMAGPVGHIENYMISLWLVTLIAPLLAARAPLQRRAAIQVYLWASWASWCSVRSAPRRRSSSPMHRR
jgi:hypothetical protein